MAGNSWSRKGRYADWERRGQWRSRKESRRAGQSSRLLWPAPWCFQGVNPPVWRAADAAGKSAAYLFSASTSRWSLFCSRGQSDAALASPIMEVCNPSPVPAAKPFSDASATCKPRTSASAAARSRSPSTPRSGPPEKVLVARSR